MARTLSAPVTLRPVFFRTCDISKPEPPVLRHGGPCIQWGRVGLVAMVMLLGAGALTLAYAGLG